MIRIGSKKNSIHYRMDGPRCIIRRGTTILYKMGGHFLVKTTFDIKWTCYNQIKDTHSVEEIQRGIPILYYLGRAAGSQIPLPMEGGGFNRPATKACLNTSG